jgi:hypothetical protein
MKENFFWKIWNRFFRKAPYSLYPDSSINILRTYKTEIRTIREDIEMARLTPPARPYIIILEAGFPAGMWSRRSLQK